MSRELSGNDIERMFFNISRGSIEEIKAFAGSGDERKPILSNGFKIQEPKSGLVYTVISLVKLRDKYYIDCERGDGTRVRLSEKDLDSYKGL
tara:strand:- start:284 stop:559 length:276 start_codon:yes stop_codon:yes gene_type:complete